MEIPKIINPDGPEETVVPILEGLWEDRGEGIRERIVIRRHLGRPLGRAYFTHLESGREGEGVSIYHWGHYDLDLEGAFADFWKRGGKL
jgi:hypothetical protein